MKIERKRYLANICSIAILCATILGVPCSPALAAESPLETMTKRVSQDLGKVETVSNGSTQSGLIIFRERHDSPLVRVEIAAMLVRLHRDFDVDRILLEGHLKSNGPLKTYMPRDNPLAALETTARLLEEGEINSAEYMAMNFPEIRVLGVEKEDEYSVSPPNPERLAEAAFEASIRIAEKVAPEEIWKRAAALAGEGKNEDAAKLLLEETPWIVEWHKSLTERASDFSISSAAAPWNALATKLKSEGVEISTDSKATLTDHLRFYEIAEKRSHSFTDEAAKVIAAEPSSIALIIGAAHSDAIAAELRKRGISFSIITPASFSNDSDVSNLTSDAYSRKLNRLSVDEPGMLGSLLTHRSQYNPSPVVGQIWLRQKSQIYYVTLSLAQAWLKKEPPNATFARLRRELEAIDGGANIILDEGSYEVVQEKDVVFLLFKVKVDAEDVWIATQPAKTQESELEPRAASDGGDGKIPTESTVLDSGDKDPSKKVAIYLDQEQKSPEKLRLLRAEEGLLKRRARMLEPKASERRQLIEISPGVKTLVGKNRESVRAEAHRDLRAS